MAMAWIWTGMVMLSLVFGILSGNLDEVANAAMAGAQSAIDLSVSMAGMLCLWSGIMEVMNVLSEQCQDILSVTVDYNHQIDLCNSYADKV